jgi:hypothetical protein
MRTQTGQAARPEPSALVYTGRRIARHAHWARTEGLGRLIEEDQLDPRERLATAVRKRMWRHRHAVARGTAMPVYVVGLQRSGTNMLLRGLDSAPEVEVRGENDRKVFSRFKLRPDDVLRSAIVNSRHPIVLVKPLCDSHRVGELLDLPGVPAGRAVWAYRDVDDRARSEVSKFGDSNLQALRRIAEGAADDDWQRGGLDDDAVALIRSFDYERMSPDTAAALFWYVRNGLYFGLRLADRPDVMLSSYDALVADPGGSMRRLCSFIGFPYREELSAHIEVRTTHDRRPLEIDPRVRRLCDDMADRLHQALQALPDTGQRRDGEEGIR